MGVFGRTIEIKGQVFSNEDLTIEGRIDGSLTCEGAAVIVMEAASVNGDIIARDLTVLGRVDGQMIATDVVHVRSGAVVTGQVMAKNFILNDGGNLSAASNHSTSRPRFAWRSSSSAGKIRRSDSGADTLCPGVSRAWRPAAGTARDGIPRR
jgi:cytoskeletal protein CcmA (bactofilin family)